MKKYFIVILAFNFLICLNSFGQEQRPKSPADVYCDLEYTVTKLGKTKDIIVLGCGSQQNTDKYAKDAVEAAKEYEYEPKLVNGEPVEVKGVTIKVGFWFDKTKAQSDVSK